MNYFHKITALQRKHKPRGRRIINGIQTNGTLIDEQWCRFFAAEGYVVGVSLDGPRELHDLFRRTREKKPTHESVLRGYELLQQYQIPCEILCVVNSQNVRYAAQVYRYFKQLKSRYITFLPLVEPQPDAESGVSRRSVTSEAWGEFLCTVFDKWLSEDIGRMKVQIFEEAARTAFRQEHSLCIFRKTCGRVPVIEHNGDFYSCDHFVDTEHHLGNIRKTPLVELLESPAQTAFAQAKSNTLPRYCLDCDVREMCNGGCPKNRFIRTPEGEIGLNYLCAGYKRFFTHCRPFIAQLAAIWRQQSTEQQDLQSRPVEMRSDSKTGRNAPCPCGSGKKYKNCCLNR